MNANTVHIIGAGRSGLSVAITLGRTGIKWHVGSVLGYLRIDAYLRSFTSERKFSHNRIPTTENPASIYRNTGDNPMSQ